MRNIIGDYSERRMHCTNDKPLVYYNWKARKWYRSSNDFPYRHKNQFHRPTYPLMRIKDSRRDNSEFVAHQMNMRIVQQRVGAYHART